MQRDIACLPVAYQPRMARMTSGAARARSVAGLWLLEQGLAMLDVPVERLQQLGFSAHGKPQLAAGPHFSISHSVGLVACALDWQAPVGLDVEQRRAGIAPRLQRAMAAPGEDFFVAWCAREAAVKASGRVGLARVRAVTLAPGMACLEAQCWHLQPLSLLADHAACVASPHPIQVPHVVDGSACFNAARGQ